MNALGLPRVRPSRRVGLAMTMGIVVIALIGSLGIVWRASYAGFSAQTSSPTNNWTAGTVALTNGQGSAMFSIGKLRPGMSGDKCVTVTSNGSLPSTVKLYTTPGTTGSTNGLAGAITLFIAQSSSAANPSCGNFNSDSVLYTGSGNVDDFGTTRTNYASGLGSWTTTGTPGEFMVFKFRWIFTPSSYTQAQVDAMQAGTAQIGFTWEAQNT